MVRPARARPDRQLSADLDALLFALSDRTRRAVVGLLGQRPRRSSEIAAALRATRPAMSRHLRVLRRAGLVEESSIEEDARGRMYSLRQQRLGDVRSWLDELESFWADQLGAFKAHAESRGRKRR